MWCYHDDGILSSPVTDGDQEVLGGGGEQLKVSDVQLGHLDGLTELDDEPEGSTTLIL